MPFKQTMYIEYCHILGTRLISLSITFVMLRIFKGKLKYDGGRDDMDKYKVIEIEYINDDIKILLG